MVSIMSSPEYVLQVQYLECAAHELSQPGGPPSSAAACESPTPAPTAALVSKPAQPAILAPEHSRPLHMDVRLPVQKLRPSRFGPPAQPSSEPHQLQSPSSRAPQRGCSPSGHQSPQQSDEAARVVYDPVMNTLATVDDGDARLDEQSCELRPSAVVHDDPPMCTLFAGGVGHDQQQPAGRSGGPEPELAGGSADTGCCSHHGYRPVC